MWDIFTSLSPNIPLGTAARQMSNIHLLLLSPVVGNCSFFLYSCISAIFLFTFVVLCVLARVRCAQLIAEAPERVRKQRDQTERDASVEDGEAVSET